MDFRDPLSRARRIGEIEVSGIVRISEAAADLRARGVDVIGLGAGEPDFPTPPHVVQAAHDAALRGQTRYTANSGTAELRQAVAERHGATAGEVLISTGAKQTIFNAFMATLDPGDEVMFAAPYWTTYADVVRIAGGRPVPLQTAATGLKILPDALKAAITNQSRWLVLNNPGNPSGAVYDAAELKALAEVLRAHPYVAVMSDEIYREICFAPFVSLRDAAPDLRQRLLIVDGVSKAYAMTGWRIGWGVGPKRLIAGMAVVQGQSTSGPCSVSQAAALAALTGPDAFLAERNASFRERGRFAAAQLRASGMLRCADPEGAFYLFPDCTGAEGMSTPEGRVIRSDADFCDYLLTHAHVAVVPGAIFGSPGHFRMSYALAQADLEKACHRILDACAALRPA